MQWNWIGYPFDSPSPVEEALSEIAFEIEILLSDDGGIWIPNFHIPINTLGSLLPGEGYLVFSRQDVEFRYTQPPWDQAAVFIAKAPEPTTLPRYTEVPGITPTGLPYVVLVHVPEALRVGVPTQGNCSLDVPPSRENRSVST